MTVQLENSSKIPRKISHIDLYSDLSVDNMANMMKMNSKEAHKMINNMIRKNINTTISEKINAPVEQIMQRNVPSLDYSKTVHDAAILMIEKGVGCIVVTAQGRPFGMVTERDILCEINVFDKNLTGLSLDVMASRPLVYVSPQETIRTVADLMLKNNIRRVPVIQNDKLVGIVVAKDLAILLSSTKQPELSKYVLDAILHSRKA